MSTYALIKDGQVMNTVLWDGEGDIFEGYETVKIDGLGVGIGWTYDGKKFTAPPVPEPTHEELVRQAEVKKQALINDANSYIDGNQWPSKLALGRLSDDDKALFNKWLDYLDALKAVDTSTAADITWPEIPAT
ncbi:tail fiber assembly protein [Enterobacter kobei]|uniref:tail fiber assembly protein n=1 Tax=Enterobacter cloacae complex TaxID=354276 RepID=UPI000E2E71FE|nr:MULTISPECIES: tail fiber assembly protein [Enterobacter cloacae complex]ELE9723894.1 tail fiber assembly protein [Enterobacter kobei]ELK6698147.1 tail fiber assembly protein [Enterobacter kobei]MBK4388433.1 tail fiber assembly protein [Enterobacter hormaechei]DAO31945.1 MAG TPA: tail fiber assembly protein [Caudoviricetes sp.]